MTVLARLWNFPYSLFVTEGSLSSEGAYDFLDSYQYQAHFMALICAGKHTSKEKYRRTDGFTQNNVLN